MKPIIKTPFHGGAVLARRGGSEMLVLNPIGAWIWEGFDAGMDEAELAAALAARFELPPAQALADVCRVLDAVYQRALGEPVARECLAAECGSRSSGGRSAPCPEGAASWRLSVGDRSVFLSVRDDAALVDAIAPLVSHLDALPAQATLDHGICVSGAASSWSLCVDGKHSHWGETTEYLAIYLMDALVDIAERPSERLLSLHAGGVVMPGGAGAVLVGAGGIGKSTLVAVLNAEGFPLLSDDIIPVTPEGKLVGLGLCLSLKAGSWAMLESRFPELSRSPVVNRFGQAIRFLPPRNASIGGPVPTGLFLFPEYCPGVPTETKPLAPECVLRRIAGASSVIKDLSQQKLEALVRWVSSAPAYSLIYPDLESGLALVRRCFDTVAGAEPAAR